LVSHRRSDDHRRRISPLAIRRKVLQRPLQNPARGQ
jgi:hypothetical protein